MRKLSYNWKEKKRAGWKVNQNETKEKQTTPTPTLTENRSGLRKMKLLV